MTIRWRLGASLIQIGFLLIATYWVTGRLILQETWLLAGLLAIIINPQLFEPWYTKPQDVLANSIIAGSITYFALGSGGSLGWKIFGVLLTALFLFALLALLLGASRDEGFGVGLGRISRTIANVGSAFAIYSVVFWLSLLDYSPNIGDEFWILGGAWTAIAFVGFVNWQVAFSGLRGTSSVAIPLGMIGPSHLFVSGPSLPVVGTSVQLKRGGVEITGKVVSRIPRPNDIWGMIFIGSPAECEQIVKSSYFEITPSDDEDLSNIAGSVEAGSSVRRVIFQTSMEMELGNVVSVPTDDLRVLYQLYSAEVEETTVKGGAHLVVRARGSQLGIFHPDTLRIQSHRWVADPGTTVRSGAVQHQLPDPPQDWLKLGSVIGTQIPVYLELPVLMEGHLAILGMTRMGKTTLAVRIAQDLAQHARVTILDQTGEYVSKRGLPVYQQTHDTLSNGLSVFEPTGHVAPDEALDFLRRLVGVASAEYAVGTPAQRVVIIDEAHQFVPEPSGIGFNSPGRDSAFHFGLLMMQVRKYGITIVLISQRTAVVAKSALSQCETLIAFKNVDQTGLDYLEAILGAEARGMLPVLEQGQAYVNGPSTTSESPVAIQVDP